MSKFYGVGYRIAVGNASHPRAYSIWQGVLKRCYDPNHVRYSVYGGAGVTVSKRWLCLDNFVKDMPTLDGWDQAKYDAGELQLDKDYKQPDAIVKIYSRKTCMWVSKSRNNRLQPSQMKTFIATSPDGRRYTRLNKAEFCRKKGLRIHAVSKCLNGRAGSHLGWTFYYLP